MYRIATALTAVLCLLAGTVGPADAATRRHPATIKGTATVQADGRIAVTVRSNSSSVDVKYVSRSGKAKSVRLSLKRGKARTLLPTGATEIRARARASKRLLRSGWRRIALPAPPAPAPTPSPVPSKLTWRALAQSSTSTCGVDTSGKAACWNGQQPLTRSTRSLLPPQLEGAMAGKSIATIAVGANHACALDVDGHAYCWGSNIHGQLGDGTGTYSSPPATQPVAVATTQTYRAIAVGEGHTCAVTTAGTAECWGFNEGGQLGIGEWGGLTSGDRTTPVPVVGTGVLAGRELTTITAGLWHSCALDTAGLAYCWGGEMYGALGQGKEGTMVGGRGSNEPVAVRTDGALAGKVLTDIAAGGHHTCVADTAGVTYCWGWNYHGQLGRPSASEYSGTPTALTFPDATAPVTALAAGFEHTCALHSDQTITCWGRGDMGALGTGTPTDERTPARAVLPAGVAVTSVSAGGYGTLLIDAAGTGYQAGARQAFAGAAPAAALTFSPITTVP